jgi:hypothetical protein
MLTLDTHPSVPRGIAVKICKISTLGQARCQELCRKERGGRCLAKKLLATKTAADVVSISERTLQKTGTDEC